ncbi:hypothetical protein EJB05_42438, partial [Eragrostis curvula]
MSVAAGVSDSAIAVRDKLRGKIGQARVKRYWPGQAPDWAGHRDDDGHHDLPFIAATLDQAFPRPGDRDDSAAVRNALRADHSRIRHAEVVSTATVVEERSEAEVVPPADDEDDEEVLEQRRRRIRERRLQLERGEEGLLPQEAEEEETAAEEEESECEADSEDEVMCVAVVKPVFVQKSQRDTVAERERIMEEKRQLEELVKKRMEERKVETRRIVVEVIMKEQIERTQSKEAATMDIDTDDELNAEDEYEAWKNREVSRIKKDREARSTEKGETEMVRKMTEQEREERQRTTPMHHAKPRHKRKFLQKYYHHGAFFQEKPDDGRQTFGLDDVYLRDFSEATGEDKMNKSILPKVMQVKKFGRRSRPKWTHLANEDTTHWSIPYVV